MRKIPWLIFICATTACYHPGGSIDVANKSSKSSTPPESPLPKPFDYPETHKGDEADTYFGRVIADPYRWLEQSGTPEIKTWVAQQEKFSANYFAQAPLQTLRKSLVTRMNELLDYTKVHVPTKRGAYLYYWKHEGLKPHDVFYRRLEGSPASSEQVVLDPNSFSPDGTVSVSPVGFDHAYRYMVYGISKAGSDWREFVVRDLASLKDLDDRLEYIKFSEAAFAGDGFYYQRFPQPKQGDELSGVTRDAAVYYHRLGDEQSKDKKIHANPNQPLNTFAVRTTDDETYLVITEYTGTYGNKVHFLLTADPKAAVHTLIADPSNQYDVISVIGNKFVVHTDRHASNFRLVEIDPQHAEESNWHDLIPEQAKEKLEQVSYLGGHFIARYLVNVTSRIKRFAANGSFLDEVKLPGLGTVTGFLGEEKATETYYAFTSYTVPETIFHYDVTTNTSTFFVSSKDSIKVDTDRFTSEQVFYTSKDGTTVPMFIIYRKDMKRDGSNPTLLYGYGGFSISLEPTFSSLRFAFLERGGILAIPNLRGGGEYGEAWHQAGMKQNKQNVFDDFIGAAEYLIEKKYTSSEKLAINGGSNGGLLVGAVMTQRPELMKVAVPEVGVLDMLRFHKFTIGHAWSVEYGNSEESEAMFKYLLGYSPLHHVKSGVSYPATLIMTSDHDDRVVPAHSFKFAAALQATQSGPHPIILAVTTKAGHGAGSSLQQMISKAADRFAFILHHTQ